MLHEARTGTGTGQEPNRTGQEPAEPELAELEPAKNRTGQEPEQAKALYTLYTMYTM